MKNQFPQMSKYILRLISVLAPILALICLFFTKAFDFGFLFLGLPRQGEFLGLVFRLADLVQILLLGLIFSQIDFKKWFDGYPKWLKYVIFCSFCLLFAYWLIQNWQTWFGFKSGILNFSSLVFGGVLIYIYKPQWLLYLLPYFCFDHVLVSSSIVSVMWLLLAFLAKETKEKINFEKIEVLVRYLYGFSLIAVFQFLFGFYQIFIGHSLGFGWLGESAISVADVRGVAKQILPFTNQIILRGYGLMPHPNILGFFAVFCLIISLNLKEFLQSTNQIFSSKISGNFLLFISFLLLLISISRMAALSFLIVFIYESSKQNFKKNFKTYTQRLLVIISVLLSLFLFFISVDTRQNSDKYRIDQYKSFESMATQKPVNLIFGVGLGQYSNQLKQGNITEFEWQNEPFYQPFLTLFAELGLVGVFLSGLVILEIYKSLEKI
jgi:hypothetical protein